MGINAIGGYVNIPAYQASDRDNATIETTNSECSADKISISVNAKKAGLGLISGFMDGAGEDGVITLDEMREFRNKKMEEAQSIIRNTLNDLGIQDRGRIEIDVKDGSVTVSGNTDENNRAIAKSLQQNDQFLNTWGACSGTSSLIAAAEAAIPFHAAYEADPRSAVDQYSWLIGKEWDFDMYFENGQIGYSVA